MIIIANGEYWGWLFSLYIIIFKQTEPCDFRYIFQLPSSSQRKFSERNYMVGIRLLTFLIKRGRSKMQEDQAQLPGEVFGFLKTQWERGRLHRAQWLLLVFFQIYQSIEVQSLMYVGSSACHFLGNQMFYKYVYPHIYIHGNTYTYVHLFTYLFKNVYMYID